MPSSPADSSPASAGACAPASWLFRHMPRVLLAGGILAVLVYYNIAVPRGANGHPAPSQTDALVYMQYARAIAEGHPYVFASGDAPSTGSTSHLYPAVLAIPYLLGAHGDALLTAAFALNALCYLLWLQCFWLVARRVAPGQAVLAAGLALLNGHLLMSVAGLTDMALFTALSWALFATLLAERHRLAALLLILCVFTRPEGMLLAAGLALLGIFQACRRDPDEHRIFGIAACGLVAAAAVLALNAALTGFVQFQSVATKGYLHVFPLLGALGNTACDFGTLVREILFNAGTAPRQSYFLPVAGGLLAIAGLPGALRPMRNARVTQWWLGCSLASLGLIALSSWQGVGTDRYLLWLLPTWYLLAARGAGSLADVCRTPRALTVLAVLLVGYEFATWPYFASRYAAECGRSQAVMNFARTVDAVLPASASVGVISGPSVAYGMGHRSLQHLVGITTPDFARQRDTLCAVEMLKHNRACRFSHLVVTAAEQTWCAEVGLLGTVLLSDLDAPPDGDVYTLCSTCWDTFPAAALLPIGPAVSHTVAALTLVDRLDVGFMPDEHRCQYQIGSRLPDQICSPCVASRRMDGMRVTEVGQPVIGWDLFRVHTPSPGQPLCVVMRTTLDATCTVIRATQKFAREGLHLRSPLQIRPIVNGRVLPVMSLPVNADPDTFTDCTLLIPAEYVTSDPLEIVLAGDHIAMAYWFYQ